MLRDQENVPYFNSATESLLAVSPVTRVTKDEEQYSTLKSIHIVLKDAVAALYLDFNAFKVTSGVPKTTALYELQRQIDGKQLAYDILAPALQAVESSIQSIDSKYKEG